MSSPFSRDFDDILQEVLTSYSNQDSSPDITEGSMPFIMGSVLASMGWGLYRYQDYINEQHFPDTADADNLNHWGSIYDITRLDTDTDASYLIKILNFLRQPPAGGNALDFENWALDSDEVYVEDGDDTYYNGYATVIDVDDGPGTVGVYTIPNDETIINVVKSSGANTSVTANKLVDTGADFVTDNVAEGNLVTNTTDDTIALVTAVDDLNTLSLDNDIFTASPKNYEVDGGEELLRRVTETYIESVRPLGMLSVSITSAKPLVTAITIALTAPTGVTLDEDAIEAAIEAELDTYKPGQVLYHSTLNCICVAFGAANSIVTLPVANPVTPTNSQFIRAGVISFT